MTAKTRANFKTDQATAFADNTSGAITAAALRAQMTDIADSASFPEDFGAGNNLLMTAAERSKLAGIETGATADQTGSELAAALDGFLANTRWKGIEVPAGGTTGQVLKKNSGTDFDYSWQADATGGGGIGDGDKGDITVSSSGAVWTIDNGVVTLAKMANISTAVLLGRVTTGTGVPEALSPTQARTLLNVEDGATADQTAAEIQTAYDSVVALIAQAEAEAGTATTSRRWTAERVGQAIAALAPGVPIGVNAQVGTAYTLVLADKGKKVTMDNAAANILTIPANATVAFPVGTILGVSMIGAGTTTVDGATGVTVNGVSGGGAAIAARWTGVTLTKIGTDAWLMEGNHGAVA